MSYCRSVNEIKNREDLFPELFEMMAADEIVLNFRNGNVYSFIDSDDWDVEQKTQILQVVEETRELLVNNGFLRYEISSVTAPEVYFTLNYIAKLGLLESEDNVEVFMPYCYSNEEYERYNFCYERIEGVFEILEKHLSAVEFLEVLTDVMHTSSSRCNEKIIAQAKVKIADEKDKILPRIREIFAMF